MRVMNEAVLCCYSLIFLCTVCDAASQNETSPLIVILASADGNCGLHVISGQLPRKSIDWSVHARRGYRFPDKPSWCVCLSAYKFGTGLISGGLFVKFLREQTVLNGDIFVGYVSCNCC